jgi:hypothetical protein
LVLRCIFFTKKKAENFPEWHVIFLNQLKKSDLFHFIAITFLFAPILWWTTVPLEEALRPDLDFVLTYECALTQQDCDTRGRTFVFLSLCLFITHVAFIRWQTLRTHAALRLLRANQDIANPHTWGTQLTPKQDF